MTILNRLVDYWNDKGILPSNEELAIIVKAKPESVKTILARARRLGLIPRNTPRLSMMGRLPHGVSPEQVLRDRELLLRVRREWGLE